MRRSIRQNGFTLIELLIVIAIIGIIAAMLIPSMLDAIQKSKQKRSVADIRIVGTAMMAWLTDQNGGAAAAGQAATTSINFGDYPAVSEAELEAALIPQYLQVLPLSDGWKNTYDYAINLTNPEGLQVMAMRCRGRNGSVDVGPTYPVASFEPTDYDQDIVWADGQFIRWPESQ